MASPSTVTMSTPDRQWRVDHAARINKVNFKIVVGIFAGIALLVALLRCILRIKLRRKLFLDDIFVALATTCLVIATAVLYTFTDTLYILEAINFDSKVVFTIPELLSLLDMGKWIDVFLAFIWTATFAIKFSFLAFFKSLIANVSVTLNVYYWCTVVLTGLTWAFVVAEPFILCPYFGMDAVKCVPNTPYHLNLGLTSFITALDIVTDAMIVSIPIIILNMTQLKKSQKAGIAVFLCLSAAMIIVALIRLLGSIRPSLRSKHDFSTAWEIFWQHFEGCIAVCMGSITAFRGIFAGHRVPQPNPEVPSDSTFRRLLKRLRISKKTEGSSASWRQESSTSTMKRSPRIQDDSITQVTLKGLRTFIRRHNREPGNTTISVESAFDPAEYYHQFHREGGIEESKPVSQ